MNIFTKATICSNILSTILLKENRFFLKKKKNKLNKTGKQFIIMTTMINIVVIIMIYLLCNCDIMGRIYEINTSKLEFILIKKFF